MDVEKKDSGGLGLPGFNFSEKTLFYCFQEKKTIFHHFWPPYKNF